MTKRSTSRLKFEFSLRHSEQFHFYYIRRMICARHKYELRSKHIKVMVRREIFKEGARVCDIWLSTPLPLLYCCAVFVFCVVYSYLYFHCNLYFIWLSTLPLLYCSAVLVFAFYVACSYLYFVWLSTPLLVLLLYSCTVFTFIVVFVFVFLVPFVFLMLLPLLYY